MSCPTDAAATAAAAATPAGCNTGAATAEVLVEGRPTDDVEEVSGHDDEEAAPMLTSTGASDATTATATAPFSKDYRLDFTDVEGNLEEIPEEGTARMAAAAIPEPRLELAEIAGLMGGNKDVVHGCAVSEGAAVAATPAVVTATAHFHIPESNASDYAYSECSFQVRFFQLSYLQGSAKRCSPGLVNFVTALACHLCRTLLTAFTQPEDYLIAEPCTCTYLVNNTLLL